MYKFIVPKKLIFQQEKNAIEYSDFMFIAAIIGGAAGYFLTNALLGEIYAYHISVSILPVALSGFIIFLVGFLTTSTTIFKAARANPVETLKDE